MTGIYYLEGVVKHYDWGGFTFIPSLLGRDNKNKQPFAEYWLGTHPLGISQVHMNGAETKGLDELTGPLPYLFKAQEVKEMLSIQVHPSREAAEKEFARENALGIPLDAPHRNYKDPNHKPEMLVALGDFWLLHGFKPEKELVYTLLNVVELRELLPVFNEGGYAGLYREVMEMPQREVNRILQPLAENTLSSYDAGEADKTDEDYWAAKAARSFTRHRNIDRGIFSIYLLNLVHLKRGEAIFQAAGVPHAYLEGHNVELMANSDNVLRGGLTTKHVDVAELLKHVKCEPTRVQILKGELTGTGERIYPVQVPDFRIGVFEPVAGEEAAFTATSAEIILCTEGEAELVSGEQQLLLRAGTPAALVLPGTKLRLRGLGKAIVFRASGAVHNR